MLYSTASEESKPDTQVLFRIFSPPAFHGKYVFSSLFKIFGPDFLFFMEKKTPPVLPKNIQNPETTGESQFDKTHTCCCYCCYGSIHQSKLNSE